MEQRFENRVDVKCNFRKPDFLLAANGDVLFALIIPLVVNGIEATLRAQPDPPRSPVEVDLVPTTDSLVIIVRDGGDLVKTDAERIFRQEKANAEDGMPGGGVFLSMHLAAYLNARAVKAATQNTFTISHRTGVAGCEVRVRVPVAAFSRS